MLKLNVLSRLTIGRLFPRNDSIVAMTLAKGISEKTVLSEEEIKNIDLKEQGQNVVWDMKKGFEKEIEFSEAEIAFLKQQVQRLDAAREITLDMLDLCRKIQEYKPAN